MTGSPKATSPGSSSISPIRSTSRPFLRSYRVDGYGHPAYDPKTLLGVLLYGYCIGVRSSRQIERRCREDLAFRVLTGNSSPDHVTIARFRARHQQALAGFLVASLKLCAAAGMVRVGTVALDGTKLAANAAQARRLRWAMLGLGGLGTFLAAIGLELWIAVTTALAGAFTTYLEAMQLENSVMLYNQAATDLAAIKSWWLTLPPDEQLRQDTIDRLVTRAERIMQAELTGWVQQMQDA